MQKNRKNNLKNKILYVATYYVIVKPDQSVVTI